MQKNQAFFICSLIFSILVTIFALTNARAVSVNLLFYQFQASQAIIIIFSATIGAIIVTFLGLIKHIKLKSEIRTLRKENIDLTKRLDDVKKELNAVVLEKENTEMQFKENSVETI